MTPIEKDLVFLILQFLDEEKFKETVHTLEQESKSFFNMKYLEDQVRDGNWDEVEKYLSSFSKLEDNQFSRMMFFEIRKQKYLEALDNHDLAKAVQILKEDLKVFASFNAELFDEMKEVLVLDNFREHKLLSDYGDTGVMRENTLRAVKELLQANPLIHDKLKFPDIKQSRLRCLINQSLNLQHKLCTKPWPHPQMKTLFADHVCEPSDNNLGSSPAIPVPISAPIACSFPPPSIHRPLLPLISNPPTGRMPIVPSLVTHPTVSDGPTVLGAPALPAILKPPNTLPAASRLCKRKRITGLPEEVNVSIDMIPISLKAFGKNMKFNSLDDLPRTLVRTLNQGSSPTSMDFHPLKETLLLVGTDVGDIALWEVGYAKRLALKNFKVWDLSACSQLLQCALAKELGAKEPDVLVNRVIWSPDGSLFGVAYSLHIVQVYSYNGNDDIGQHLEIDAHIGKVNDLAFSCLTNLLLVTCGDDKTIKVWDAKTGTRQRIFKGHETPVYCVCPHNKGKEQYILSTSVDGKIKAWVYEKEGSVLNSDSPSGWCTTLRYSGDGTRLFSCGTSRSGESHMVEWDDIEGLVKRIYQGFQKKSPAIVQFDTAKNRFLVAGDGFLIKFWDMNNDELLVKIDVDGSLPESPRIRVNKVGSLMAASANETRIKILANKEGLCLLKAFENLTFDASSAASVSSAKGKRRKPGIIKKGSDISKLLKVTEINEPSQCRSLKLPENVTGTKISSLTYTKSGSGILALASNAIHLLWKWKKTDQNSEGKATARVSPQLWKPAGTSTLMRNDVADSSPNEAAVHCFALSKNDSYLVSASGGSVSLFNVLKFEVMLTSMRPPPAATFLAFHPQDNNIIAIGLDDSTINISDIREDKFKYKLNGHSQRVTGFAFSLLLNVLVSSGADAQLCVWSLEGWEKKNSRFLELPAGGRRASSSSLSSSPLSSSDTRVQFHQDQIHFLVVHETQLAIFETTKLESQKQWLAFDSFAPISHATYSCDSQLVYASFLDASVCIFTEEHLQMQCRINPSAYIPNSPSPNMMYPAPLVIAAHPQDPNQFAIGSSDGAVHVFEPPQIR